MDDDRSRPRCASGRGRCDDPRRRRRAACHAARRPGRARDRVLELARHRRPHLGRAAALSARLLRRAAVRQARTRAVGRPTRPLCDRGPCGRPRRPARPSRHRARRLRRPVGRRHDRAGDRGPPSGPRRGPRAVLHRGPDRRRRELGRPDRGGRAPWVGSDRGRRARTLVHPRLPGGRADLRSRAAAIRAPTLCVAGDQDLSTPPDLVRGTAELIPGARFALLAGAGHIPCVERPAALAALIAGHLSDAGYR